MNYYDFANNLPEDSDSPNKQYHTEQYSSPTGDDNGLFERLVLEINRAGPSRSLILKKQQAFQTAYKGLDIDIIAAFGDADRERLLTDAGIARNRLKISAAIYNAQQIRWIRQECGSLKNWLDVCHPRTKEEWVALFKKHLKFMGGEIVGEFLMSAGYLFGAHAEDCKVYQEVSKHRPKRTEAAPVDFMREWRF